MVAPPIGPIQQVVSRRHAIGTAVADPASAQVKKCFDTCAEVRGVFRGELT